MSHFEIKTTKFLFQQGGVLSKFKSRRLKRPGTNGSSATARRNIGLSVKTLNGAERRELQVAA
jgi:hypothetical protein